MRIEMGQRREQVAATLAHAGGLLLLLGVLAACRHGAESPSEDSGSLVQTGDSAVDAAEQESDGAGAEQDAELDAEVDPTDGSEDVSSDADSAPPDKLGTPCEGPEQCDDGVYCNGVERCAQGAGPAAKICLRSRRLPCPPEHACSEVTHACNCDNKDVDGDGDLATACGGTDCDDSTDTCRKGLTEICDANDVDEDCDPTTVGFSDEDGDHAVDHLCRNFDVAADTWNEGADCNDHNPSINREASEVCDYYDNNCNGWVDEKLIGRGEPEHANGGLMSKFLPDFDRDLHGKAGVEPILACEFTQPPGYVEVTEPLDCDDGEPGAYFGASERCDGIDNDCDGQVDETPVEEYHFPGTELSCVGGSWVIAKGDCPDADVLWCPGRDPIGQGCRTDATRLSSCRECQTNCRFSCGQTGCDEIITLTAGAYHACAGTTERHAACWGRGAQNRLGSESSNNAATAQWVDDGKLESVHAVVAGVDHTCAVVGDERALYCWGSNTSGKLGNDEAVAVDGLSPTPVQVAGGSVSLGGGPLSPFLTHVVSADLGIEHTCAVVGSGRLTCWGDQADGRLANGEVQADLQTLPGLTFDEAGELVEDAESVAVGHRHGCIRTRAGDVGCWGDNSFGQLGRNPAELSQSPLVMPVPGLHLVTAISAGAFHTCAVSAGRVFCWGENRRLQLGRSTDNLRPGHVPQAIDGLNTVVSVESGIAHNCAILPTHTLQCWGANDRGQLGSSALQDSLTPIAIPLEGVESAALGERFSCASTHAGSAYCWGDNSYGQLGIGQSDRSPHLSATLIRSLNGSRP